MKKIINDKRSRIKSILGARDKHSVSKLRQRISESNQKLIRDIKKKHPSWAEAKVHDEARKILDRLLREL